MVKKRISKSRKKSYLKRNSRRNSRQTNRRKDKRKIKKTRKKNKRGGSRLSHVAPHLLELPVFAEEAKGKVEILEQELGTSEIKNLFDDSRSVNVLETLYGGDPEEVGRIIEEYNSMASDLTSEIWSETGKLTATEQQQKRDKYDTRIAPILKKFQSGHPTYILISGHGVMINCIESTRDPCFTLLPRGYKLILPTATGEVLSSSKRFMGEGYEQNKSSYYRMYEGLIPNQEINFNLVYRDRKGKLLRKFNAQTYVTFAIPGVNITGVKAPYSQTYNERGQKEGKILDYYVNFKIESSEMTKITLDDAQNVNNNVASTEEIETYADAMVEGILPLPETPIEEYMDLYSIMPIDKIKEQIVNSVTPGYSGNFDIFKLSQLLKHIEEAGSNVNVPKVILGSFCRSGDFNYDIDGLITSCKKFGLKPLMKEYFSGNISYEGVSDELRRGISLASKTKPQDFWGIYDNIASNLSMFETVIQQRFETVRQKIEDDSGLMENDVYKGINLSLRDVCLIFQMDQHLQIKSR